MILFSVPCSGTCKIMLGVSFDSDDSLLSSLPNKALEINPEPWGSTWVSFAPRGGWGGEGAFEAAKLVDAFSFFGAAGDFAAVCCVALSVSTSIVTGG